MAASDTDRTTAAASGEERSSGEERFFVAPPAIEAPKGGGAIRGIGEKFAANPVTGTGSLTIPIPMSAGRDNFGPTLALSYDSGAGNGPFGFGWSLGPATITRKTDRGLPRYRDAEESDVFVLAGAEDLVPVLGVDRARQGFLVRRYRPRVEGAFARVERWSRIGAAGDVSWRVTTRDNVTTIYGDSADSRIAAPQDPTRIFSWLAAETYDDRGNSMVYAYAREDSANVDRQRPHERHRAVGESANRYLASIRYGNRTPRTSAADLAQMQWLFEIVLDYGDGHWEAAAGGGVRVSPTAESPPGARTWPVRPDAFSTYRAGFEVRASRRCRRVLMFHRFPELGPEPLLVRSLELDYRDYRDADPTAPDVDAELAHAGSGPRGSFLCAVTQRGHVVDPAAGVTVRGGARYRTYRSRSLPPIELTYSRARIDGTIREVGPESLRNLPAGVDGTTYRWVDLDGEGLTGVLTEQAGAWFYKRNVASSEAGDGETARLGPLERVALVPSTPDLGAGQQLVDLDGDGRLELVQLGGPAPGFFARTADAGWEAFRAFDSVPNLDTSAPAARMVDLTGDGLADLLVTDDGVFTWYASRATEGFAAGVEVPQGHDLELGPRLVFSDTEQSLYLADMSGDGLADFVRIRNGEICYWPSLGYGRFGARITMDGSPWFDEPDRFDHRRIRIADLDGSGTTDLVYLGTDGVALYFNRAGNGFTPPRRLRGLPPADELASVTLVDLLGNGTVCLVWSSSGAADAGRPMHFVDLMSGEKPHLLVGVDNQMGSKTEIAYAPSTRFYLADRDAGKPWPTRLPFPVQCVERVTVHDRWRGTTFATSYSYHHGYFDGEERELRGFGRVEQLDVETFGHAPAGSGPFVASDDALHQPPIKTVSWYHTGAAREHDRLRAAYAREQYRPRGTTFAEPTVAEPELPRDLAPGEWAEALRACKGTLLRREVYVLAVDALPAHRPVRLFSTESHASAIQRLQPRGSNRHGVFLASERETVTCQYDLDLRPGGAAPDPRVTHTMTLTIDRYGNALQTVTAGYPRAGRHVDAALPPGAEDAIARVQRGPPRVMYGEQRLASAIDDDTAYRLPTACETLTYELTGLQATGYLGLAALQRLALSTRYPPAAASPTPVGELPYHARPTGGVQKRLVEHGRTLFFDDALTGWRPLGEQGPRALVYETYKLALTGDLISAVLGLRVTPAITAALGTPGRSGYISGAPLAARFGAPAPGATPEHWIASGVATPDAAHFYLPLTYTDPFGHPTQVDYAHDLVVVSTTDAAQNTMTVDAVDYRVLAPSRIRDANDKVTAIAYDAIGLPTAVALLAAGDDVAGVVADVPIARLESFFTGGYLAAEAAALLADASARHLYHLGDRAEADGSVTWGHHPAAAATILRERHRNDLATGAPLQTAFEYTDGGGTLLVKKAQAEPAPNTTALRWIASGKVVVNNKGKPVRQYEPYFSSNEHRFEELVAVGVASTIFYDAAGRTIRTEAPDGSYSRVEHSPWHVATYDANDTTAEPGNRWYAEHAAATASAGARRAAAAAREHADTPTVVFLDALGRDVITVRNDRFRYPGDAAATDRRALEITTLDTEGKPLWIRDARGNLALQCIRPVMAEGSATDATAFVPGYDLAGNRLFEHGMDSGDRWRLSDATGQAMFAWDEHDRAGGVLERRLTDSRYDALHRLVAVWLQVDATAPVLIEELDYGEGVANDRANNLRGRLYTRLDHSGRTRIVAYDHAGRPRETERRFADDARASRHDWQTAALETETFMQVTVYDALGRPRVQYGWHRAGDLVAVCEPRYNERGLLASEELVVRARKTAAGYAEEAGSDRRVVIAELRYDAKGQRQLVRLGNGTRTRLAYDPDTYRLVQLRTTRPGYDPPFPSQVAQFQSVDVVQNLLYTYDAVGNVLEIHDDALRPAFFANQAIEPAARYTYDALYRLIAATGREHAALGAPSEADVPALAAAFPVAPLDPLDQRNYAETFRYDAAGNLREHAHAATTGWTRTLEPEAFTNRLARTWLGSAVANATTYAYDAHGNQLNLANVPAAQYLQWDHRDLVHVVWRGGGGEVAYQYDSSKQRTRKVAYTQNGTKAWERRYLGGTEIYRRYDAGGAIVEQVESHHVRDGDHDLLLVEDVLQSDRAGATLGPQYRYQYGNHLGSSCLELDDQAALISYEEYHPCGTTAYRAARSQTDAPKRYRFTGMERDDESGLSYHGARYYAPWLARWVSCDPSGLGGGLNRYAYCDGNPLRFVDLDGRAASEAGQQNAFSARTAEARLLTAEDLDIGLPPPGTSQAMVDLIGPQIALPPPVSGLEMALHPPADPLPERGPVMYDPSREDFERFVNSVGPFSRAQNKMMNEALATPVLGIAFPTVAVGLGAYSTVLGYDALFRGDYDLAKGRFLLGIGLLTAAKPGLDYRAVRGAYANAGGLMDRLKAAVIGDKGVLNTQLTISVGVGRTQAGTPVTLVSVNAGAGPKLTAQVRALAEAEGAVFVEGAGHAEINILEYASKKGLRELMIDASIPHCGGCTQAGVQAGAQLRNTSRGQYWYRGKKYGVENNPSPPPEARMDPSASDWLSRHTDAPWE